MKSAFLSVALLPLCLCADLRLGIVGTDTSHVTAFTKILNDSHAPGARVVAAWKGGSPDLDQSRDRIEKFTSELQEKWGVRIVPTIEELARDVDAVLLTSVDGRVHLAQARAVIAAHKPLFIDKPLAATLEDAREIARLADQAGVPWFSASSLRFSRASELRRPDLEGAATWGPGPLEPHHPLDLSWYAIHPVEMLYAILGPGCEEVTRMYTPDADVITGRWKDGRLGTVRALRPYGKYGAVAFGRDQKVEVLTDVNDGYVALVREIVRFFETRRPPVPNSETLEIFAFLDAAQRSKEAGGKPMRLK